MARFLRSFGIASVFAFVLATPVAGGAPERFSEDATFEFTFAECDGFDIVAAGSLSFHEAVFTNHDGTERIVHQFKIEYTMIRSDDATIVGTGRGNSVLLAPLDGTPASTWVGARAIERYVGGSTVVEIGRIVFDTAGDPVFVAGPHPFSTIGVDRCAYVQA